MKYQNHPKVIWVFPKIGVPQNGWFIRENPIRIDDLGVPLFLETPISCTLKFKFLLYRYHALVDTCLSSSSRQHLGAQLDFFYVFFFGGGCGCGRLRKNLEDWSFSLVKHVVYFK